MVDRREEVRSRLEDAYGGVCPMCGTDSLKIYTMRWGSTYAVNCQNCGNNIVRGSPSNLEFQFPKVCDCGNDKIYHNGDEGWFCPFCERDV